MSDGIFLKVGFPEGLNKSIELMKEWALSPEGKRVLNHEVIFVQQPIYYYCSYWQHWDEILGWNKETQCIVVKEVGANKIREHCTTIEKSMLSTVAVDKNSFNSYDDFKNFLEKKSNKAWIIWRDSGIPRRLLKFDYD